MTGAHMTTAPDPSHPPRRHTPAEWFADSRVVARAKDDRGRRVVLLDPARVRASAALAEPATAARLAWARAELRAGTFGLRAVVCGVLLWVAFPVLDTNNPPAWVWLTVLPVWAGIVWTLNRYLARRGNPRRTHRIGSLLASHGLCPSCAYGLADLSPEADGCTVCPECGGAWRRGVRTAAGPGIPGSMTKQRRGWRRHMPCVLTRDDRRETHASVRLTLESLLALPWSDPQRRRLQTAMYEARDATRTARRWMAAMQFGLAAIFFGMTAWFAWTTAAFLIEQETALASIGGVPAVMYASAIGMSGFWAIMGMWHLVLGRSFLASRGWASFPKGSACLPRHDFCAACYNDLRTLAPDPDGCTVCPECGAAWRLGAATPEGPPGDA